MRSQTIRFEPIRRRVSKSGNCPDCGQRATRQMTFEQTVSPFNRDRVTGEARTADQVWEALRVEADAWEPDFTHQQCAMEARS